MEPRPCSECGEPFQPTRKGHFLCSSRCRSRRSRRLRAEGYTITRPGFAWKEGQASPDDPMFQTTHLVFINRPEEPASDPDDPILVQPRRPTARPEKSKGPRVIFRGLLDPGPNEPWTIHLRPKPGSGEQA
jgi:hypothetical protein